MVKVAVAPESKGREVLFVLISTVIIIVVAMSLISVRSGKKVSLKLRKHQVSAFSELNTVDQSLFSELFTAALDVEIFHRDNSETWPTIKLLEENYISPFAKDAVWESRGRIKWKKINLDKEASHRAAYLGKSMRQDVASSFILYTKHMHGVDGSYIMEAGKERPYTIWFKKGEFAVPPEITEGTLIKYGWKEAVPHSGNDELKKLDRNK